MLIYWELVVVFILLAILARLPPGLRAWPHRLARSFTRFACHRRRAVLAVGLYALLGSVLITLWTGWPQPHYTDEFGYLLAADTFAHGRLSTPPHPMWVHFENFHILQQPTYASQYPPAQGLFLAAGQVLIGRPLVGVWLSLSLACMAICWMLQAYLPPRWALLGALLATTRLVFWGHPFSPGDLQPGYWSQGYFGGAVPAGAGALVFGALRRLITRPRVSMALLLGLGLAVLANSRPYEGFACCLPAAVLLFVWMFGKKGPTLSVALTRVVLPIGLVLGLTLAGMAYYNLRVTGRPLTLPYQVHEETYATTPAFLWQPLRPVPHYRHPIMAENYLGWFIHEYEKQRSPSGLGTWSLAKCGKLMNFYLGLALLLPLIALRGALRNPWTRFALLTCVVEVAAFLMATGGLPHYIAPITGLLFLLVVQALRQVYVGRRAGLAFGRAYVQALLPAYLVLVVLSLVLEHRPDPEARHEQRARILERLTRAGGRHLVLVRYESKPLGMGHEEWVYNAADVDASPVVWAREMGAEEDRKLLEYYCGRRVWRVNADDHPPRLEEITPGSPNEIATRSHAPLHVAGPAEKAAPLLPSVRSAAATP